ncbi:hypothetical protein [Dactylosporangium matsuzakiense]|uniref:hypothetical protein n=1 Tax=Dactylosporangium matsuzakiense TaxID=53360 RepID=UPI0021C2B1B6|nr:hypothetical protein [Dactylosporangium matsuzakiense]UWZ44669.1 hypothetical protein Dmats_46325 [Dactylosporangium matsuzakiense]
MTRRRPGAAGFGAAGAVLPLLAMVVVLVAARGRFGLTVTACTWSGTVRCAAPAVDDVGRHLQREQCSTPSS